jgi:DNA-binding IscR family transcriptional regulator
MAALVSPTPKFFSSRISGARRKNLTQVPGEHSLLTLKNEGVLDSKRGKGGGYLLHVRLKITGYRRSE